MTAAISGLGKRSLAAKILKGSGALWYLTAVAGQGLFFLYILAFYYGPTLTGNFEAWNRRDLITGYVPGDSHGNLAFALHVLVAALITLSGALQLLPAIRRHLPRFHHWNGRFYVLASVLMAGGGLWLVWGRGTYLNLFGAVSISILAVLLMVCAFLTVRYAMKRDFDRHHAWALRTFMLVNAVWFQRVGYMAWILINQGPVGIGERMDGPFDIALGFAVFLVPLTGLEFYLRAAKGPALAKLATAGLVVLLTAVMAIGIFGTYALMWKEWLPF